MATITFSLSKKKDGNNYSRLLVEFKNGISLRQRAKTSIFVYREYWDEVKQDITIPKIRVFTSEKKELKEDAEQKKEAMAILVNKINKAFMAKKERGETFESNWLQKICNGDEKKESVKKPVEFFECFADYIDTHPMADHRRSQYKAVWRCMKRFALYEGVTLTLDNVTSETLCDFREWLRDEYLLADDKKYQKILSDVPECRMPKERGNNTIVSLLRMVRAFWLNIIDSTEGKTPLTTNNPFNGFKVGEEQYTDVYFLEWDEVKKLYKTDFSASPYLEQQRDVFVFQCCVGCRVSDLLKLTSENVIEDELVYIPIKTKSHNTEQVRVPLNNMAQSILEKYKGGKKLLPFTTSQQYNYDIKTILTMAKITRKVSVKNPVTGELEQSPINVVASSHIARRTFVGNLYRITPDPNIIGKMSGHVEGSRAFARYRKIDKGIKQSLINALDD